MNFKTTKLDLRFSGYPHWKYFVTTSTTVSYSSVADRVHTFSIWREWCWNLWGSSKELELFYYTTNPGPCHNAHWCWSSEDDRRRIYLANDEDLMEFTLRWA